MPLAQLEAQGCGKCVPSIAGSALLAIVYRCSADIATGLASSCVPLGVKKEGDKGEEVCCFQGNQGAGGPLELAGWPPNSLALGQGSPTMLDSAHDGVDCRPGAGSAERSPDTGRSCWLQHGDGLLSSSMIGTCQSQAATGGSSPAPQDRPWALDMGPSQI